MKSEKLAIEGLLLLTTTAYPDDRGYFSELFNQREFEAVYGRKISFVQDNFSRSERLALRGLHYQLPPKDQGKLVRCTRGIIFDVAVDLRQGSATLGKWVGVELSEENRRALWIPSGFAHGFIALGDVNDVQYKTTDYYSSAHERSISWRDPKIKIDWPVEGPFKLSPKDQLAGSFDEAELFH